MSKYTKEEKAKYFADLRANWKASKELAEKDEVAKALFKEAGLSISYFNFYMVLMQMQKLGFEGLPYVDCKTFNGWRDNGFRVIKGQQSKIQGVTWLKTETKDGTEDDGFVFPKTYYLFHKSQVEEIK